MEEIPETFAHEYLSTLAVSRLFLDNIGHFQTSWVTQGKKIGQLGLFFGADDMGSIMIEENVVSAAGTVVSDESGGDGTPHSLSRITHRDNERTSTRGSLPDESTAAAAQRFRHALTPQNRDLAEPILPVVS